MLVRDFPGGGGGELAVDEDCGGRDERFVFVVKPRCFLVLEKQMMASHRVIPWN